MSKFHFPNHNHNRCLPFSANYKGVVAIMVTMFFSICIIIDIDNTNTINPIVKIKYYSNNINQDTTIFGLATVQYSKNLICNLIFKKYRYSEWMFVEDVFLKRKNDTLFRIPHEYYNNSNFPMWPRYMMDNKDTVLHPFIVLNQKNFIGEQIYYDETLISKTYTPFKNRIINLIKYDSIHTRFERKYKFKRTEDNATVTTLPYLIESGEGIVNFNYQTKEYNIKLLPPHRIIFIRFDSLMMIKELSCIVDSAKMLNIILTEDNEITKTEIPLTVDYIRRYALNW